VSNINIRRVVDNIRSGTNVYTPVIELIVNALQAIRTVRPSGGLVTVTILRSGQGTCPPAGVGTRSSSSFASAAGLPSWPMTELDSAKGDPALDREDWLAGTNMVRQLPTDVVLERLLGETREEVAR
jgi:hypothetical protein